MSVIVHVGPVAIETQNAQGEGEEGKEEGEDGKLFDANLETHPTTNADMVGKLAKEKVVIAADVVGLHKVAQEQNSILAEVQRNLKTKTQEFDKLTAEKQHLDAQVDLLTAELAAARTTDETAELRAKLERMNEEKVVIDSDLAGLKTAVEEYETQISNAEKIIKDSDKSIEGVQNNDFFKQYLQEYITSTNADALDELRKKTKALMFPKRSTRLSGLQGEAGGIPSNE
jgi:chromosome segregation ATPase